MTLAIMQPTYLPWAGYFNLISRVQRFVFLNNVQLDKPSWQVRNRILLNGRIKLITVPTLGPREQRIDQTLIDGHTWRRKHLQMLTHAYGKHPHGSEVIERLGSVLLDETTTGLEQLNVRLVTLLADCLGLGCTFSNASEVETHGTRSLRLVELCRHFGVSHYLSPAGSRGYIEEERAFDGQGIEVEYQQFVPVAYAQRGAAEFVPSLSIVDVAANLGWAKAGDYVRAAG
jgi:hypothetical protein